MGGRGYIEGMGIVIWKGCLLTVGGSGVGSVITGGKGSVMGGGVSIVGGSGVVVVTVSLWDFGVIDGGSVIIGGSGGFVVVDDGDGEGSGVIGVSGGIGSVMGDDETVVFSVVIIGDDSGRVEVGV